MDLPSIYHEYSPRFNLAAYRGGAGLILLDAPGLYRNVKRFQGGLGFKADRLVYHSTPGLRVIKKKKSSTEKASTFAAGNSKCPEEML